MSKKYNFSHFVKAISIVDYMSNNYNDLRGIGYNIGGEKRLKEKLKFEANKQDKKEQEFWAKLEQLGYSL